MANPTDGPLVSSPLPPPIVHPPTSLSSVHSPSRIRKAPHCTKCGRPRAGHPRQGCPYDNSSATTLRSIPISDSNICQRSIEENFDGDSIEAALSRLKLESDEDKELSVSCSTPHHRKGPSSRNHTDQPPRLGGESDQHKSTPTLEYHVIHDALNPCARDFGDELHGRRSSNDIKDDAAALGTDKDKHAGLLLASAVSSDQTSFLTALTTLAFTPSVMVYILRVPDIPSACKKAQDVGLYSYVVTDMPISHSAADHHERWRFVCRVAQHYTYTLLTPEGE
jgi:hypothetical protein